MVPANPITTKQKALKYEFACARKHEVHADKCHGRCGCGDSYEKNITLLAVGSCGCGCSNSYATTVYKARQRRARGKTTTSVIGLKAFTWKNWRMTRQALSIDLETSTLMIGLCSTLSQRGISTRQARKSVPGREHCLEIIRIPC